MRKRKKYFCLGLNAKYWFRTKPPQDEHILGALTYFDISVATYFDTRSGFDKHEYFLMGLFCLLYETTLGEYNSAPTVPRSPVRLEEAMRCALGCSTSEDVEAFVRLKQAERDAFGPVSYAQFKEIWFRPCGQPPILKSAA